MSNPTPGAADRPAAPHPAPDTGSEATVADSTIPAAGNAYDPWSREAHTVPVDSQTPATSSPTVADSVPLTVTSTMPVVPGGADVIEFGAAPKRRRRTPWVLAIVGVIVLLLGAGAYAGVRYWTGGGIAEPETAMPAGVIAFARVDLNPGARDKLAVDGLVKKFPAGAATAATDLVTSMENSASTAAGLDYTTDVKPWFGGQAGIAAWPGTGGKPTMLLAFASKDDTAAKAALAKARAKQTSTTFGYAFANGFALVAESQADATAAATATKAHDLADSAPYRSAVRHLSGHNLVIAYADLAKLSALLPTILSEGKSHGGNLDDGTGALGPFSGILTADTSPLDQLKGTIIVGGGIVDDGIEIREHSDGTGIGVTAAGTNVRPTLDAMPDTTLVGLAADGADPNGATAKSIASLLDPALGGANGGATGARIDPAITQAMTSVVTSVLTAHVISLSFTGLSGKTPSGFLALDMRDAASAQAVMSTIDSLTGGGTIPGVSITSNGTSVRATLGDPGGSGKLSSEPLYRQTMSGMTNAHGLVYVDVQKLVALARANGAHMTAAELADVGPIKSIGASMTSSGASTDELVRVIIKK